MDISESRHCGDGMPYEVGCQRCGCTLYRGFDVVRPDQVLSRSGYRCGGCGAALALNRFRVEAAPAEGTFVHPLKAAPERGIVAVPR